MTRGARMLQVALASTGACHGWPRRSTARRSISCPARACTQTSRNATVIADAAMAGTAGAVVGALSFDQSESNFIFTERTSSAAFGAFLGGVPGLVIGAVQGLVPRDRFAPVPLDRTAVRLNVRRLARGLGLAVAF